MSLLGKRPSLRTSSIKRTLNEARRKKEAEDAQRKALENRLAARKRDEQRREGILKARNLAKLRFLLSESSEVESVFLQPKLNGVRVSLSKGDANFLLNRLSNPPKFTLDESTLMLHHEVDILL